MNDYGDLPLLDEEQIAMLMDAGGDAARELFDDLERLFIEETEPRLTKILNALTSGDLPIVAKQAHAIAGASANLGGVRLSSACKAIERIILDDPSVSVATVSAMTGELRRMFDETIAALHAKIVEM